MTRNRFMLLAGLQLLLVHRAVGQSHLVITKFSQSPTDSALGVTIHNFADSPDIPLASAFLLEVSTNLASGSWFQRTANFTPVPGQAGYFSAAFSRSTSAAVEFYRVRGLVGSSDDPDGDGLTSAIEAKIGSNPNLFDTDGDGFSDGQEYAYGTNPLDKTSKPGRSGLPTVSFVALTSKAAEGASPYLLPLAFDRPYTGTVNYRINPSSTAKPGADFTLGGSQTATQGSVAVNGTTASIPLTLVDDANVSGLRSIVVDLQLNGNNYVIGGRASHAVVLSDNDGWWAGSLMPASGEVGARTFRVKITHQGGVAAATFGAGVGQDGLAVPAALGSSASSVSTAFFPVGQWPATQVSDTPDLFHAVSPVVTSARRAGSVLSGSAPLSRQLELNTQPKLTSSRHVHSIKTNAYFGEYTENLIRGGVTNTLRGSFVLVRDAPAPLPPLSNLLP